MGKVKTTEKEVGTFLELVFIKINRSKETKVKPIICAMVVNKKSPKLDIREIYSIKDSKELVLGKDEKIIKVEIKPIK